MNKIAPAGYIICANIHIMGVPQGQATKNGQEIIFEKIMTKSSKKTNTSKKNKLKKIHVQKYDNLNVEK